MSWFKRIFLFLVLCGVLGLGALAALYLWIAPTLPDVDSLKTVQLQTPMRIYSKDGALLSQFGEKRRIPVRYEDVPQPLIDAFLATEDARFFEHKGVDPIGVIRAAVVLITTGRKAQGASTITMQVARNFFLSREKTYIRKVKEIFLALKIEQLLSKEEILELYLNRSFLGNRAYGVGAAAQVYYGKDVDQLTLAQMAMIAGLPQAPSAANPIRNPQRAFTRRNVVLGRMLDVGFISQQQFDDTRVQPISARYHGAEIELDAPYVAEMAREIMVERFGEDAAYTGGYQVYTSIETTTQRQAQQALRDNLYSYDRRHGYRGPIASLWQPQPAADTALASTGSLDTARNDASASTPWERDRILQTLADTKPIQDLLPAVVMSTEAKQAMLMMADGSDAVLSWEGMNWGREFISDTRQGAAPKQASDILSEGDLIWVRQQPQRLMLAQVPQVSSALVALNPDDGAVRALVGGYNFQDSQYNRVTQAKRQLGSNIKPFIYSAALEQGYTLATLVNNAPINQWDRSQGTAWRPKNSPDVYTGPTRVRRGLGQSVNVMAVRTLRHVGIDGAIAQLQKFGFDRNDLPRNESLALGSAVATPMDVARGFATFTNGGFKVEPYVIERIENSFGQVLYQAQPKIACAECEQALQQQPEQYAVDIQAQCLIPASQLAPRILSPQVAFLIKDTLSSVIWGGGDWSKGTGWNGTAWRAAQLIKRRDIGGKTGTTNESRDTWFSGFGPGIVATSWVGFDNHSRQLGRTAWDNYGPRNQITGAESGAKTAGPAWNQFMNQALKGVPTVPMTPPEGVVTARIDLASGKLSRRNDYTSRFEFFVAGTEPTEYADNQQQEQPVFEQETEELF
ncbi:penicillin-binding protein 1A [Ferrimonas kyonanensis]|uniref:penicillin-binding protein 1A n=1 Tax=Ferrimonas kyonanensis TaxID=364763 RepID=UPI0003FEACA1|nr:PBP1A family penicillin-binding protein [Ferrimonas kyonanensis]